MADHYRPDHVGMRGWLRSGEARGVARQGADRAAAYARGVAPVDTGAYRASIHTEDSHAADGRAAVDVVSGVEHADDVERTDRVLRRAEQIVETP